MTVQFISTNKNYKRLYTAPLDPSSVWESENELRKYLTDPTCYTNQLVGCGGKAYIIIEVNGVKDIKEIGTVTTGGGGNDGGNVVICELDKYLSVGNKTPLEDEIAWIDTSDIDQGITDDIPDLVINEFREMFKTLQNEIITLKQKNYELEARIIYLEEYGGGNGSGDGGDTGGDSGDDTILTFEDESILTFEDGSILTFENAVVTSNDKIMTFETDEVMTFEGNETMIFE